jgi:Fe-Mn family superoxide dismutase
MAPPGSDATKESAISAPLTAAVKKSFGGFEPMKKAVSDAATGVFGSGWAWLCLQADGALIVATTANQDNPLMGTAVTKAPECTPILGVDVWEHA